MVWQGMNQRTFPRVNVACDLTIDIPSASVMKTKTENLGAGGVCVILDKGLDKLSTVHLQIMLTDDANPVKCDGRIVWLVCTKQPGLNATRVEYDTGIEFTNLEESDRERISRFIQKFSRC